MDLILGACAGYRPHQIRHFVESLRRCHDGLAILITAFLPAETKSLLSQFGIEQIDIALPDPVSIQVLRYLAYQPVINSLQSVRRVFITDVRDVLFQANPFDRLPDAPVVAFLENETIAACKSNSAWIDYVYGPRRVAELGSHLISCAGTVGGTRDGIARYLALMQREIQPMLQRGIMAGCDQGMHNHLLHGALPDAVTVPNQTGAVQTLSHQGRFHFDQSGHMLNLDGSVCPVLHQIDRIPRFLPLLGVDPAAFEPQ